MNYYLSVTEQYINDTDLSLDFLGDDKPKRFFAAECTCDRFTKFTGRTGVGDTPDEAMINLLSHSQPF